MTNTSMDMHDHLILSMIERIRVINPERSWGSIIRRTIKLFEEAGEVAGAYLPVTSVYNGKGKTWGDVLEEAVDTFILAVDIALTPRPTDWTPVDLLQEIRFALKQMSRQHNSTIENEICVMATHISNLMSAITMGYNGEVIHCMGNVVFRAMILCMMAQPVVEDSDVRLHNISIMLDRKLSKWAKQKADAENHIASINGGDMDRGESRP